MELSSKSLGCRQKRSKILNTDPPHIRYKQLYSRSGRKLASTMAISIVEVFAGISTAWIVKSLLQKYLAVQFTKPLLRACPGGSILWLHPFRTFALVVGPMFPFKGQMGYYFAAFALFKKYGSTCLSSVTFWNAIPTFWLSDADAIKTMHAGRAIFPKDIEAYETLNIYGENLVSTEGANWKRHRSVANSAFNETNHAFVWRETIRVVDEWFEMIDGKDVDAQGDTSVDLLTDLTQVALLVISSAGFGRKASLREDLNTEPPPGHKLAFRPAVTSAVHHVITKAITPTWLYNLSDRVYIPFITPILNEARLSFDALALHMHEVIAMARAWIAGGKTTAMDAALLRNLVEANMNDDDHDRGKHLTDDEVLSDTFTFLLAGHETSAHSLCFAIILLALYPDIQQRVYEEALRLWPDGVPSPASPTPYKESMANLEYTTAVFYETLRHFPPVARLAKNVLADTTLTARRFSTSPEGKITNVEKYDVPIKTGSIVVIDIVALHNNPIHWGEDVAEFKPERFIDTDTYRWPRDAFNAFSGGPRSCIGQRFSVTESTCILAHVARKYEVHIPDDLKNKSWEEQKRVLLAWKPGITITPKNARVVFRRRSQ
ncbi:putative cytochrome p450 [Lyophyllum shimeji]|uniref:Cytochrome p450 n=1 Tax=Lyophyllum shimeji TaxID=47721 RepID=A0A9P3PW49_LYOSH|nr:putative cytochrome p450 [Lyophyllum shimeji]